MQLKEETRTDIEELYIERIAAFNIALNERLEKIESNFDKKQLEILRAKNEFLEMENFMDRKRTKSTYRRNRELQSRNDFLESENKKMKSEIMDLSNEKEITRKQRNVFRNLYYKATKK